MKSLLPSKTLSAGTAGCLLLFAFYAMSPSKEAASFQSPHLPGSDHEECEVTSLTSHRAGSQESASIDERESVAPEVELDLESARKAFSEAVSADPFGLSPSDLAQVDRLMTNLNLQLASEAKRP